MQISQRWAKETAGMSTNVRRAKEIAHGAKTATLTTMTEAGKLANPAHMPTNRRMTKCQ